MSRKLVFDFRNSLFLCFVLISCCIIPFGCREERKRSETVKGKDAEVSYIDFRSFQNSDRTWGFTIFVNNVPFRHYNRIPVRNARKGFVSQKQAEDVAHLFVKLIKNGEASPRLDRKSLDSLGITLSFKSIPDS